MNKIVRIKVICPLTNFQIQTGFFGPQKITDKQARDLYLQREKQLVEGIDLIDGIKIKRISREDLEELKTAPLLFSPNLRQLLSSRLIVLVTQIPKEMRYSSQIDEKMRNIVLALRLFKSGYVHGSHVFHIHIPEKKSPVMSSLSYDEEPRAERIGCPYALNFDEIPEFKRLLEKVHTVDFSKRKSFALACKRFQRAYEDVDAEDQLIDLMIAFEALFLKGQKAKSPSGQIIAVACSILLGKNEEEREEIRTALTKAYTIRNYIVHGAEYKFPIDEEGFGFPSFVNDIEDYLREALKKLLE